MLDLLIIKPSSLGDIVHALIAVQSIKTQRPEAKITWVIRSGFVPLLESVELVDQTIVFDRKGGISGFFNLLSEIHKGKYDASLDMQALLRTGLMSWAARAPLKLCRHDQTEGAQFFANKIVPLPPGDGHAVDKLMEFLPPLGLQKIYAPLKLKPDALTNAPKLPAGTILIFPASRGKWANKEWPFFKELTEALLKEGKRVAWSNDAPLEAPARALDFCGKIPLAQLLPFIAQARLVIGNDAGPTHMAAALGVPTLGLYGPTDPALAGPYPLKSPTNIALRAVSEKMEDLPVEEVLHWAKKLYGNKNS